MTEQRRDLKSGHDSSSGSGELQIRDASGRLIKVRRLNDVLPYLFTALILYGLWTLGNHAIIILERHFVESRSVAMLEHNAILEQIRLANYFLDKLVPQQYRVPLELPLSLRNRQQDPRGMQLRLEKEGATQLYNDAQIKKPGDS